jgi:hypothetical protein
MQARAGILVRQPRVDFASQVGGRALNPAPPIAHEDSAMSKQIAAAALLALTFSACSSGASFVRKDAIGGRVQLEGAYMPAMSDARTLMVEQCNGRFDAVELGDAVEFHCRKVAGAQLAKRVEQHGERDTTDYASR